MHILIMMKIFKDNLEFPQKNGKGKKTAMLINNYIIISNQKRIIRHY